MSRKERSYIDKNRDDIRSILEDAVGKYYIPNSLDYGRFYKITAINRKPKSNKRIKRFEIEAVSYKVSKQNGEAYKENHRFGSTFDTFKNTMHDPANYWISEEPFVQIAEKPEGYSLEYGL
jgi:hypothetical protein